MKFLFALLAVLAVVGGGYLYFHQGAENTREQDRSPRLQRLQLHDLKADWPKTASATEPIVFVNEVPMYKGSLRRAYIKATVQLKPLELFREAILTELRRQNVIERNTLNDSDEAELSPPTELDLDWLLSTKQTIYRVLAEEVADQGKTKRNERLNERLIEPSAKSNAHLLKLPTQINVATIKLYYKSEDQLKRLLIERKMKLVHTQLVERTLNFGEAQRLYSESQQGEPHSYEILRDAPNPSRGLSQHLIDRLFSCSVGEITEPIEVAQSIVIFKVIGQTLSHSDPQYTQRVERLERYKEQIAQRHNSLTKTALQTAVIKVPSKAAMVSTDQMALLIPLNISFQSQ